MPGPPPPPAPPPPGPPPPSFPLPKLGGGGADDRGALLKSIRQGAKLKKTVTNDKSAPIIPGKVSSTCNNNSASIGGNAMPNSSVHHAPNGLPLGGLFAGGMPKLKATGRLGSSTLNSSNSNSSCTSVNNNEADKSPSPRITPSKNFNSIQDQLKRQLHNPSDTKTRGPPPPAPTRNISVDESRPAKALTVHTSSNGLHSSQTSLHANVSSLHNNSALHRKSKSNANLSSLDCTDSVNSGGYHPSKPVINHGKPNLAPKPPILNGKPTPPTKLAVKPNKISRAQSMRTPRSPSPQSPTPNDASIKFGTVRNMSSIIGQSLTNLNSQNLQNSASPRPRPPLKERPSVPPPSVPPPAAPSAKPTLVKPPNHAPPPPPPLGIPQPPSHAPPPPPPHKTQPCRPPPAVPTNNNNANPPPPPPPRHSSMRDVNQPPRRAVVDLEEKFKSSFSSADRFPRPPPYRNVLKLYSNRQAANKQQAPLPPQLHLQPLNKVWNPTSTC